jgi:hypothetical protein
MANNSRKHFRPETIFFETVPLLLDSISLIQKPEQDKEYVLLKSKMGVTYSCFDAITYRQLEAGKRYKFTGNVNVTPGAMYLVVMAFERIPDAESAMTTDSEGVI